MSNTHPIFAGIIGLHFPALAQGVEADRIRAINAQVDRMFFNGEYDGDQAPVRERITPDPDAVAAAKLFNRQEAGA